jgi:hypothetical protein
MKLISVLMTRGVTIIQCVEVKNVVEIEEYDDKDIVTHQKVTILV